MAKGHAVIDGSNLATEGRSEPSLAQLDEAVAAFIADHDFAHITVVVDASFEHRVTKKEQAAARREIDEGRIITPPAGVIGRGDMFILEIADRAGAVVVSNDSFQEFHGRFDWIFDEGRLIGGKPVEHVGWIFVPRAPVRGPTSQRAVRKAKADAENDTEPAPTRAPATKKAARRPAKKAAKAEARAKPPPAKPSRAETPPAKVPAAKVPAAKVSIDSENPARAWQRFRRANPVGSSVDATVERFSSHGAYAVTEGLSAYLPLRLLADPAPSRARDVLDIGEDRSFVVHEYHPDRRGIDLGLVPAPTAAKQAVKKRARKSRSESPDDKHAPRAEKAAKKSTKKAKAAKKRPKKARQAEKAKKAEQAKRAGDTTEDQTPRKRGRRRSR